MASNTFFGVKGWNLSTLSTSASTSQPGVPSSVGPAHNPNMDVDDSEANPTSGQHRPPAPAPVPAPPAPAPTPSAPQPPPAQPQPTPPGDGSDSDPNPMFRMLRREVRCSVQDTVQNEGFKVALRDAVVSSVEECIEKALAKKGSGSDTGSGEDEPPPARRPKKSKTENSFHAILRDWLAAKELRRDAPPMIPAVAEIQEWEEHRRSGPNTEAPLFDWTQSFSSPWNDELLGMLAEEFLEDIITKISVDHLPPPLLKVVSVKKLMATKLRDVRTAFMSRYDHRTGTLAASTTTSPRAAAKKSTRLSKNRHTNRTIGTYTRRAKIIKHHQELGVDVEFWGGMGGVLEMLGCQGMSSDESENEEPTQPSPTARARKRVRRKPRRWLNSQIASLWEHVEKGYNALPEESRRGNPPYERIFAANPSPPPDTSKLQYLSVVKHLPTNWYDRLYWVGLTSQAQKSVSNTAPIPLPRLPAAPAEPAAPPPPPAPFNVGELPPDDQVMT